MKDIKPQLAALVRQIVALAVRGAWPRGKHVTEMELAGQLGTSRTPVRSAMRVLVEAGLVEARPNHGFYLIEDAAGLAQLRLQVASTAEDLLFADILRDRLSGALPDEITQAALFLRYKAKRPVLTSVLTRLVDDGLLRRGAGRTWHFADSVNDRTGIRASYEFRLMVEPAAIMSASFRPPPDSVEALRQRHLAVLTGIADERTPMDIRKERYMRRTDVFALDAEFHGEIAGFANNPFIQAAVRQQTELRRLFELGTYEEPARIVKWCGEHLMVLDALVEGRHADAAEALRRHLQRAADDTLAGLSADTRRSL